MSYDSKYKKSQTLTTDEDITAAVLVGSKLYVGTSEGNMMMIRKMVIKKTAKISEFEITSI